MMTRQYTMQQIVDTLYDIAATDVCAGIEQDSVVFAANILASDIDRNPGLAKQIITVEDDDE